MASAASLEVGTLTTAFSLPTACYEDIFDLYIASGPDGSGSYLLQGPTDTANCLPSGWVPTLGAYFSGSQCPIDYTPACLRTQTAGSTTSTIYTCCPDFLGFTCASTSPGSTQPWQSSLGCVQQMTTWALTSVTYLDTSGIATTTEFGTYSSTFGDGSYYAYSVEMRWTAGDAEKSTSSRATSSTSSSSTDTRSATSSSSAPTSTGSSGAGSLSSGASAGVGIGAALIVILLATGAFLLWRRRRRRRRRRTTVAVGNHAELGPQGEGTLFAQGHGEQSEYVKPELPGDNRGGEGTQQRFELEHRGYYPVQQEPAELHG